MKTYTDTQILIELFKIGLTCFLCGFVLYRIMEIEKTLNQSFKKVGATKSYLYYFDENKQLDKCEILYWNIKEK